jgi:hypothetical protein
VDGLICCGFCGLWLEGFGVAALLHCMNHCVLSACVRVLADGLCAGWMVGAVSIEGGMGHGPWFMDCHEEGGFGGCLAQSISRLCYGNCDAILKSHQYSYQEKFNFGTVSKRGMFHRAALRHGRVTSMIPRIKVF